MNTDYVSLEELAQEFGLDRSNARKYILAQGFVFSKIRSPIHRQLMNVVTSVDAEQIREARKTQGFTKECGILTVQNGYFYVIHLYPDLSAERVKLGFATSLSNRLAAHRTVAPTSKLVGSWPCKSIWERTAMESVTRLDCTLVANEVYDCANMEALIERCNQFFALMPVL